MGDYRTMDASDGNYLVVNGVHYPVINSWVETESQSESRKRWGIVTEGQMHDLGTAPRWGEDQTPAPWEEAPTEETGRQPERAGASVCTENCDGADMCTGKG